MRERLRALMGLTAGCLLATSPVVRAADISVAAGSAHLAEAVAKAAPGDRLVLARGTHSGRIVIKKPLTIEGKGGAIIDAGGTGTALIILTSNVTVRGLTIRGSGTRGEAFDSGVYIEQGADHVTVEENRFEGNLFRIVLHGSKFATIRRNHIANRSDLWPNDRGNGIHIWNNTGALIDGNTVTSGRDGIYIEISHDNVIRANKFEGLRFAVHYMYANDNEITDNVSIRNRIGFALMYSKKLKVYRNLSISDLDMA